MKRARKTVICRQDKVALVTKYEGDQRDIVSSSTVKLDH